MSESENVAPSSDQAANTRGGSNRLSVVLAVLLLAGVGAAGWWYVNQPPAAAAAGAEAVGTTHTGLLPFEPFIVNLSDAGGRRYLRASILLVVPDQRTANRIEENALRYSRIRSAILELLTTQKSDDLGTPEGRAALKHAIAETAKQAGQVDVRDVLFNEFVVQ